MSQHFGLFVFVWETPRIESWWIHSYGSNPHIFPDVIITNYLDLKNTHVVDVANLL